MSPTRDTSFRGLGRSCHPFSGGRVDKKAFANLLNGRSKMGLLLIPVGTTGESPLYHRNTMVVCASNKRQVECRLLQVLGLITLQEAVPSPNMLPKRMQMRY